MIYACNPALDTLFTQIDAEESGIDFTNNLEPGDQLSIMTYPYFYNEGGVAAGDINNDGLIDLYFASNQVLAMDGSYWGMVVIRSKWFPA